MSVKNVMEDMDVIIVYVSMEQRNMQKQELIVFQKHVEIIDGIKEKNVMVEMVVMNVNVKKIGLLIIKQIVSK